MAKDTILLALSDPSTSQLIDKGILTPAGYQILHAQTGQEILSVCKRQMPDLIFLSEQIEGEDGLELAGRLLDSHPQIQLLLLPNQPSDALAIQAMRVGFTDCLQPPIHSQDVLLSVQNALQQHQQLNNWAEKEGRRYTHNLQQRLNELEALQRIGHKISASLDLDNVLSAVVEAAVELTEAEEGSLLLIEESTGELYMRAAKNFQDEFVRTFRLPTHDSLAGQVLRTGKPVLLDEKEPQKIKTSYLVHNLLYVPLQIKERVIGVLGVDNRQGGHAFNDAHLTLLSALADYAAIAIENARLYAHTEVERSKLETILTNIAEGVIVIDQDRRLILVNRMAREMFELRDENVSGRRVQDVIRHNDLVNLVTRSRATEPFRTEIALEDGRVFYAQLTPIADVGQTVTLQDITYLKELDRIKSDFVSIVSHDLRSPLTAILGYVELLDRVGPLSDLQREFISRVQFNVNTITSLINDLLDLGRIEAGFDARNEIVPIDAMVKEVIESLTSSASEKSQELKMDLPPELPVTLGDPVRLRQMLNNLVSNAIRYTQDGGTIWVRGHAESEQVILQVADNGPGIPLADQPHIFDKFYRASNIPAEVPGTGLGLAIVKSIVENQQGRIWVDSNPGQGSTFTIVLPITDREL
ncbi:MAG: ATP-binding protein [Anaerolineales bacterium]|jgi:two-component system phosphate regulon sensor histidine kinase PhoR